MQEYFALVSFAFLACACVVGVIDHVERLKRVESVVDRIEARLMDDEDGDDADAE